jgi:tetratricopeptide (TPR) repeat protein
MRERSDRHQWLLKRARRYARSGNSAGVENVMQQLLSDEPDDTVSLGMLGAALFQSGRAAEAIDAFSRALRVDPDLALIRYQLGLAQAALAQHNEALDSWQTLLDDKNEFMAHYQSALGLLALGKVLEAGHLIETARKRMPQEHPLSEQLSVMAGRHPTPPVQTH